MLWLRSRPRPFGWGPAMDQQLIFDNLKQPQLTIAKVDAADSTTPIPGTVFRIEAIDSDYQHDVTTGQDGTVTLRVSAGHVSNHGACPFRPPTTSPIRMPTGCRPSRSMPATEKEVMFQGPQGSRTHHL